MPSPNPTVRRQHSGNAVPTTLSAPIVNGTDTSFTITSATGWPDGSVGNFVATINAGQSDVEKILCSTRSGTTVNVVTRGFDSTTAAGHAATATAAHTISALEVDEANQHTNATTGVHGVTGAVVGTTDAQTLSNKVLTAPTINNGTLGSTTGTSVALDGASSVGGVTGTQLAADRTAWTAYTPTFTGSVTNPTLGNSTIQAHYRLVGKTLNLALYFGVGSSGYVTGSGTVQISLPLSLTAVNNGTLAGWAGISVSASNVIDTVAGSVAAGGSTITFLGGKANGLVAWSHLPTAGPYSIQVSGTIEVQ